MKKEVQLHILLIDNYDSFSYNLVDMLRKFEQVKLTIMKNDDLAIFRDQYDAMIISPGPGLPSESAFLMEAIDYYRNRIPILGICLGLQALVEYYKGSLKQLSTVFHGIQDEIHILGESPSEERNSLLENMIFQDIPSTIKAGRYHSWVADPATLPSDLQITAVDSVDQIMAIQHKEEPSYALQFHPESFMTEMGHKMMENFINLTYEYHRNRRLQSYHMDAFTDLYESLVNNEIRR